MIPTMPEPSWSVLATLCEGHSTRELLGTILWFIFLRKELGRRQQLAYVI